MGAASSVSTNPQREAPDAVHAQLWTVPKTKAVFDEMCDVLMEFEKVPYSMRRVKKLFYLHSREGVSGEQELFFDEFLQLMKSYEPLPYSVYR